MSNAATDSGGISSNEEEVRRRVKQMRDEEVVDFVRDLVVSLDALADRLEAFADNPGRDSP